MNEGVAAEPRGQTVRSKTGVVCVTATMLMTLVACGDVDDSTEALEQAETAEPAEAEPEAEPEPEAEAETEPEAEAEAETEAEAEDWSDRPEGYSSLYTDGVEPDLDIGDGEVGIAAMAPPQATTIPLIVHNGTGELVSRVEVSGALVDTDGSTITSGTSHGFEPNAIAPGEYGIGYFYGGVDDVPQGASLDQISIDYRSGLSEFEDILAVDITDLDATAERATGTLANPHDVEVTGPISVVLACLDDSGTLTRTWSTFADRDNVEADGSSTFTVDFYGDGTDCAGVIAGGSGYNHEDW
jgi:hypothetical protein